MVVLILSKDLFPPRSDSRPMIYAYTENNIDYEGLLKVGYTTIGVKKRIDQQYPTKRPEGKIPYTIVFEKPAMYKDGSSFTDHAIHSMLSKKKIKKEGGEWFKCTVKDLEAAYLAVRNRIDNVENRTQSFKMRPEQEEAVRITIDYYNVALKEKNSRAAKFLWNAKMRFGKTFAAYQLARRMGLKKILVLTFKPVVEEAWNDDLMNHIDFEGWQYITCRNGDIDRQPDLERPLVCFGSFQDLLGTNASGGIKTKNEWVHTTNWDLVVFDEYHFGAWRDNAKKLFEQDEEDKYDNLDIEIYKREEADNAYNETFLPITTNRYLFMTGTPFRAINSGEFIEEQIYSWTYSDEQREKVAWGNKPDNPYAALPRMVMLTYKIPESIRRVAIQGEFDEFDLNIFFSAKGKGEDAKFVYEEEVQKWLDLIRGAYLGTTIDDLKLGAKPDMPYSNNRLLNILTHTLWFLPNVASCFAMHNLLRQKQNTFYNGYKINVCAGPSAGVGYEALAPVQNSMEDPLNSKTITLSCGKLTTGVTIKPWTGIFMLRNLSSPETYFQAAFRVQNPWEVDIEGGKKEIMKHECYILDFALDRALRQIADYSCRLNVNESNPEIKVGEFIKFLPVIAYDGSTMRQINASEILDITMAGTSATLLAKRWESALLVNVDNETLARLMANEEAMRALESIEGFRSLNSDIQTIINLTEAVKKAKTSDEKPTSKEKKELSDQEKEFKSKRKQIQEKLIKFATRIPIFMYLTDYREYSLKDVITQIEPGLFKKVTGLDVKDFELLVSLNVFNGPLMNDAVYKFKRYEDASLTYTGINKHEGENVGGYDTVLTADEYNNLFAAQQNSMELSMKVLDKPNQDKVDYPSGIKTVERKSPTLSTINTADNLSLPTTKIQDEQVIDTSVITKGTLLTHNNFGVGTVVSITAERIIVVFGKAEKMFIFPDALHKGFLKVN